MNPERDRIKRKIGYQDSAAGNELNRAWSVTTYVHVNGERYLVTDMGDRFLVRVAAGVYVCGETLEIARDRLIEALDKALGPTQPPADLA